MAADAGLGSLPHFDFNGRAGHQVVLVDAETAGGHLSDGVGAVAVEILMEAALAGVVVDAERFCGAGKAFVPMVIMLLFWCVVRITYITIVMRIIHEIQYIYMASPITWSLSSIVYFLYYHFSDWVHGFDKKPKKI